MDSFLNVYGKQLKNNLVLLVPFEYISSDFYEKMSHNK